MTSVEIQPQQDTQMSPETRRAAAHRILNRTKRRFQQDTQVSTPSLIPLRFLAGMECITADATTPNQNTKKTWLHRLAS